MTAAAVGCALSGILAAAAAPGQTGRVPAPAGESAGVRVVVSTADGQPVAGQPVVLEVHDGRQVVQRLDSATDSQGVASFDGVPAGPGLHAQPLVSYGGAEYRGEPAPLTPGERVAIPVTVYAVTSEGQPLHVDTLHLIVNALEPGLYQVAQVMRIRNVGEAAYAGGPPLAGGGRAGAVIPVPAAARAVAPIPTPEGDLDPDALVEDGARLLDRRPVPPGVRDVAIAYELVGGPEGVPLEILLPYPTQRVSLLVGGPAADRVRVEAQQLVPRPAEELGGQRFARWTAEAMAAGQTLSLRLAPARRGVTARTWALLAAALGVSVAVGTSLLGGAGGQLETSRRQLIERIAELDLRYEGGEVTEARYFAERAAALELLAGLEQGRPRRGRRR